MFFFYATSINEKFIIEVNGAAKFNNFFFMVITIDLFYFFFFSVNPSFMTMQDQAEL